MADHVPPSRVLASSEFVVVPAEGMRGDLTVPAGFAVGGEIPPLPAGLVTASSPFVTERILELAGLSPDSFKVSARPPSSDGTVTLTLPAVPRGESLLSILVCAEQASPSPDWTGVVIVSSWDEVKFPSQPK